MLVPTNRAAENQQRIEESAQPDLPLNLEPIRRRHEPGLPTMDHYHEDVLALIGEIERLRGGER